MSKIAEPKLSGPFTPIQENLFIEAMVEYFHTEGWEGNAREYAKEQMAHLTKYWYDLGLKHGRAESE